MLRRYGSILAAFSVFVLLLILAGCGSGGGGSSAGPTGTTAGGGSTSSTSLNVYVTDAFSDDYSQVLVTLYKIEATTDGTTYQTLFQDDSGQTVDVTSLANAAQLLSNVQVPNANFTQVRVTLGNQITLVPKSGGTGMQVPVDINTPNSTSSNGQVVITLAASTMAASSQLSNLVVDFNLAAFQLIGGHCRPSLRPGDAAQFQNRPRFGRLIGTVANLNPGVSFDLQGPRGQKITVNLSSSTTISGDSGADAALANGQLVVVEGTGDPAAGTLTATAVHIKNTPVPDQGAVGSVASVNTPSSNFVLTVRRSEGFSPTGGTITVQTDQNTQFRTGPHSSGSLSDLTTGSNVLVEGTFDNTSQTLTARSVLVAPNLLPGGLPPGGGPHDGPGGP